MKKNQIINGKKEGLWEESYEEWYKIKLIGVGNYINDKRTGEWQITQHEKKEMDALFTTEYSEVSKGNYKNGYRDGVSLSVKDLQYDGLARRRCSW